jgi:hypothetical protein
MTAAAASRRGDNRELVALARGGGLNFVGAAITQLTTVGLLLYMTRDLSKTDVGLFRISVALFELLMIVALVGLGQAMTRYVAVFRADRDRAAVLGAIRLGIVVTTVSSVLVGALLFLASPWLSNTLYNEPGLVTPLRFVAFAIPPGALTAVALAACSGFRTMRPNALIGLMLDPILRLVLIVGALQLGLGLDGVLWAFVVIPYITCLLALLWLFVLARGPQVAPRSERRQIMRFASVAWVATFTTQGLLWLDLLILPAYISAAELAIYSVATSVVVLATFAMSPISQSLAPRIADLTRRKELRRLTQKTDFSAIESATPETKAAQKIKTHHNVGGLPADLRFQLIEPLRYLFKDEVRKVGLEMGLPEAMVLRQPFPGPGLAIRIIGEVTAERLDTLREADWIVIDEIKAANLYRSLWQSFAILTPVRSVGVMGDGRTYANVVAIRAVTSEDGMTADWAKLPYDVLGKISSRIVNEVPGVNRVVYDISSKPPATIEWE